MTAAPERPAASVYLNRRMAALLGLGFASGLPLMLTGQTLAAWMSVAGVDVTTIALLGLVAWPYALKFVAAPLMDRYVPPFLGRRRGWLIVMQVLLIAGIAGMALVGPATAGDGAGQVASGRLLVLAGLAFAVALFSAAQDIVGDAYRTDVLEPRELGAGAAVWVTAYRVALILTTGGALWLAGSIGWRAVYLIMAGFMAVGVVATLLAPEPAGGAAHPVRLADAVVQPVVQFVRRYAWRVLPVLGFVLLFQVPDRLAKTMTAPFLLQHLAFSEEAVGTASMLGIGLTIAGALLGGVLVARLGLVASLWVFGALQALSNAGFWWLAQMDGGMGPMVVVMAVESLCAGLVTAGFLAFLMGLCDRRYSAFQFALLTSLMAFAGPAFGAVTGELVKAMGYADFFLLTILTGLPAMLLLPLLREPGGEPAPRPTLAESLAE